MDDIVAYMFSGFKSLIKGVSLYCDTAAMGFCKVGRHNSLTLFTVSHGSFCL